MRVTPPPAAPPVNCNLPPQPDTQCVSQHQAARAPPSALSFPVHSHVPNQLEASAWTSVLPWELSARCGSRRGLAKRGVVGGILSFEATAEVRTSDDLRTSDLHALRGIELRTSTELPMFHTFQMYVSNVPEVCCKCFIWMLHMLQWLYTYVASFCSQCFICFFRRMLRMFLQWFQVFLQVFQMHVSNFSSIFRRILQVLHLHVSKVD